MRLKFEQIGLVREDGSVRLQIITEDGRRHTLLSVSDGFDKAEMFVTLSEVTQILREDLMARALAVLREWREEGRADECYSILTLAEHLGCDCLDLYDRDTDEGALQVLREKGDVGITLDERHVFPQGGRFTWEKF